MSDKTLKEQLESTLLTLIGDLAGKPEKNSDRETSTEPISYNAKARAYVKQSPDIKFKFMDQCDTVESPLDRTRMDAFIVWLDETRLQFRTLLTDRFDRSEQHVFEDGNLITMNKAANTTKYILIFFLLLVQTSCMKHSCYECKDDSGRVVKGGCDKTREEVREYAETTGLKCTILPD